MWRPGQLFLPGSTWGQRGEGQNKGGDILGVLSEADKFCSVLWTMVRGTDRWASPVWQAEQPHETEAGTPCHGGAVTGSVGFS